MTGVLNTPLTARVDGAEGPRARDLVIVAVAAIVAVVEASLRTDLDRPALTALVIVGLLPTLMWRRSHPLAVVAVVTVVTSTYELAHWFAGSVPQALGATVVFLTVPYSVFRWGTRRTRVLGGSLLGAGLTVSVLFGGDALARGPITDEGIAAAVAGFGITGGACLVGALRRERVLGHAREIERARMQDREALARDLHDTVAHHVSAIAIHAQAAGALLASSDSAVGEGRDRRVSGSLDEIETEAQAALDEMRTLVRTLREPDAAPATEPLVGLADLARLADPGPPVVTVSVDDGPGVPAVLGATLYRIAQEGITNARRHGVGRSEVRVCVAIDRGLVEITVKDDGHGGVAAHVPLGQPVDRRSPGHGLRGMSERVALLGGELSAGPGPGGGWTLRATLPLDGRRDARERRRR